MPARDVMPSTIKRSPPKAQRTWAKTHDSAVREYGEGERAHRTAFAALKHSFEKVGDRWVPKKSKGPSDPRARRGGRSARRPAAARPSAGSITTATRGTSSTRGRAGSG
jgi:hypothetical protein